ncbi:transcription factor 7-like 2 isoform X2 [Syngnathoides biaculeatus]|uniref:transcription factor 7-like 2 isoform X2 n=1 Tax=Syngnathoides biaculeatus TaxID=300417 RepID=UPI002ADD6C41|nr:transcription factor 7-like 2 isoform X2 [Syngnathoides biaculeatus]
MDGDELSDRLCVLGDQDVMGDAPAFDLPASQSLPSPRDPAGESVYAELRTVEGEVDGSGVWFPVGKMSEVPAPMMAMTPALEPPCGPGFMMPYSHGLSLPYDWSASPFHSDLCEEPPAATMQPEGVSLSTIGHMKGEDHRDEKKSEKYIKKPLNAFMLFRQEQRPRVVALFNIRNSADVNKVVGQMWKSLSKTEQRKYFELADAAKLLHTQQHPDWSCTENYGKKRKRQRVKVNCNSQEDSCQGKRPDLESVETRATKDDVHQKAAMSQKQLRVMLEFML